jgi:hypothetical protein
MRTTENHQVETDSKLYNVLTTYTNSSSIYLNLINKSRVFFV